jgi:hypothetical protein
MRFEFVNDVKEMKRNELCVDYGKPVFFVQIFTENVIFLKAITFAKSTK